MEVALLVIRLGLAAVFGLASAAKLADRDRTRRSLSEFGLPSPFALPGSLALPAMELAVAVLLVPNATARWAALAALTLLLAFGIAIARAYARGEQPDCNCFGQLHSAPAGPAALARNSVLGVAAAWVATAGPGESLAGAFGDMTTTAGMVGAGAVAVGIILVLQAWFSWQLFRQHGRLIARVRTLEEAVGSGARGEGLRGLPEGTRAPSFELPDLKGRYLSLQSLLAPGRPLALVFLDPDCGACELLLPELSGLDVERRGWSLPW